MADSAFAIPRRVVLPGDISARSRPVRLCPPIPRKTRSIGPTSTHLCRRGTYPAIVAAVLLVPGTHSGVEQCGLRGNLSPFSQSVYGKQESVTTCNV